MVVVTFVMAANVINALGGRPAINHREFIPNYPLPMGIGGSLIVGLERYSRYQVKDVFMEIPGGDERQNSSLWQPGFL